MAQQLDIFIKIVEIILGIRIFGLSYPKSSYKSQSVIFLKYFWITILHGIHKKDNVYYLEKENLNRCTILGWLFILRRIENSQF